MDQYSLGFFVLPANLRCPHHDMEAGKMRHQQTPQAPAGHLDAQLAELMEQVWACEAQWRVDDHIDAAIKYGRDGGFQP